MILKCYILQRYDVGNMYHRKDNLKYVSLHISLLQRDTNLDNLPLKIKCCLY